MNGLWSRVLLDALATAGVRDLVLSPGSRSTPLVLAALGSPMALHPVADERSAGFLALGRARATGRPVALVCTSGSAGAHYLPALVEAAYAGVPLLVLTADRPPELHGCGAPQTIDQSQLFAACAALRVDLGLPEKRLDALRGLRRQVARAVAATQAGPVHLNAPFRKPLEPVAGDDDDEAQRLLAALAAEPAPRLRPAALAADDDAVAMLAGALRGAGRAVIACGPAPLARAKDAEGILALAAATGFPLVADASSQLRFVDRPGVAACDGIDAVARADDGRRLAPELVLQIGPPPVSAAFASWSSGARRVVISERDWPDPTSTAEIVRAPVGELCRRSAAAFDAPAVDRVWRDALASADRAACAAAEVERDGEAAAVRASVAALPSDALLLLGNSLPVRLVDSFCPGNAARASVLHQRGASGIDGLIAGAAGAALGSRPVLLLCGDVSFAHDLGSLAAARRARAPLAIVVLDNGGGRIFEQLPVADLRLPADDFARLWLTPPEIDLASACAAFGVSYARADDPRALAAAVEAALASPGATVVHAPVPPASARDALARLGAAARAAIEAEPC